ncbi:MAG TPA: STAS domain-containing protein [Gaiellales bacterium]|nr:STAS domain-containing protein [Gaiellales bacterium]
MAEIRALRDGSVDVIRPTGEYDLSNVDELNEALRASLSDETSSCLLDLTDVTFMDSSVIHTLVRWCNDVQLSEREALAIVSGGDETAASRLLDAVGIRSRLPVFTTSHNAMTALLEGQRSRKERSLQWLTDAELQSAREQAQRASDEASRRLQDIDREEQRRTNGG